AERLSVLAADLLDLSRVDAGESPLSAHPVDVHELLEQCVTEVRAAGRQVTYDVQVAPAGLTVQGDPGRLRQLVTNLVDNATRHSPAGGEVRILAEGTATGWRLEVADAGPGIAPADRERVFERFGTLAESGGGGGTGLGLAIARWVTDLHGGSIGFVDPEPAGSGARVRVALPHDPHQRRTDPRPERTPERTRGPASPQRTDGVPEPAVDALFGRFWPETTLPGNVRAVWWSLGVGLLAGIVLPFRDLGLGTFVVLLAAGGVVLGFAVNRR
ncbi:MAG: sensor histidine kinase, partial [Sphingomonadaceae bacterium]